MGERITDVESNLTPGKTNLGDGVSRPHHSSFGALRGTYNVDNLKANQGEDPSQEAQSRKDLADQVSLETVGPLTIDEISRRFKISVEDSTIPSGNRVLKILLNERDNHNPPCFSVTFPKNTEVSLSVKMSGNDPSGNDPNTEYVFTLKQGETNHEFTFKTRTKQFSNSINW